MKKFIDLVGVISSGSEAACKLFCDVNVVSYIGILKPVSTKIAVYKSLKYSKWRGWLRWDVQVEIYWLLEGFGDDASIFLDGDLKISMMYLSLHWPL